MTVPFLDLARQSNALRGEVIVAIEEVIDSGRFLFGERCAQFEREFAQRCSVDHCVGVASGTDAITLALRAGGVRPGDRVITSALAPPATAAGIVAAGARLVVVDVDRGTLTLDPTLLQAAVTADVRAIVPVHLYGQPCDMGPIIEIARQHRLLVIEDAAQAHLAEYDGRPVGAASDAAAFSFYPTKNLGALGDAGAIVTRNAEIAARVRLLRDQGEEPGSGVVESSPHSRLDEVQAAVLLAKLPRLEGWTARRREIAGHYRETISKLALAHPDQPPDRQHVYHLFVVRSGRRQELQAGLRRLGIETRVHYPRAIHQHPAFVAAATGPVHEAERAVLEVLSLPLYPELSDVEVESVADALVRVAPAAH